MIRTDENLSAEGSYTLLLIRIFFIRISRMKFGKFYEYAKNKSQVEILNRI